MKKYFSYFVFIVLCLIQNNLLAQDWVIKKVFIPGQTFQDVFTLGETTFAASALYNGTELNIKKTTDNGATWEEQASGFTAMPFREIDSPNGTDIFMVGNSATLIHNSGTNTWSQIVVPTSSHLRTLCFVDENIGYIGADDATLLKTENGGATWENVNPNVAGVNTIGDIYFINENKGFMAGFNYMQVTEDAGANWTNVEPFSPGTLGNFQLQEIQFIDDNVGFVCGDVGMFYKTLDGGYTWTEYNTGTTESLQDIVFMNESEGYACGFGGTIIQTLDGGITWTPMTTASAENNRAISFSGNRGFMVNQIGEILTFERILSVNENEGLVFAVSPNPASAFIDIYSSGQLHPDSASLINVLGQQIRFFDLKGMQSDQIRLSIDAVPSGHYILELNALEGKASKKIIVE
ncbi:MAG: T9SS type A sorting domain-containing protein [Aequorivita sp.]|nr:T9SS type A sorting domain-containing protein [Aequorivita sp.]